MGRGIDQLATVAEPVLTKEDALCAIALHRIGFRDRGNALRKATKKPTTSLCGSIKS